ncbi:cytochrome c biogenesis CcdA family protein [soil metagenome]
MIDAPLAFAFAAGLVATLNPCGFAMLPAYLSYFVGLDGLDGLDGDGESAGGGVGTNLSRALVFGGVVSLGFLIVFGVVGILVTLGLRAVIDVIPWAALIVGVLLVALGVAMAFFRYEPTFSLPKLGRRGGRGYGSVFGFGVSYAIASLSCGLPIFLVVVSTSTTRATNFASGFVTFMAYGAGMSMLLLVVTLALALAKDGLVRWMRRSMRYVGRVSGAILIVVGAWITWFWIVNLNDPLAARNQGIRFVEGIQQRIADQLGERPGFWAVIFGLVIAAAVAIAAVGQRRSSTPDERDDEPGSAPLTTPERSTGP